MKDSCQKYTILNWRRFLRKNGSQHQWPQPALSLPYHLVWVRPETSQALVPVWVDHTDDRRPGH